MDALLDPARLLRNARRRSGLTQRALADRAGTSQSVVARIERGQSSPTAATLGRLLHAAGHRLEVRLVPTAGILRARAADFFEQHAPPGIVAAFLHGSTARGARHRESDVDVGVLLDHTVHPTRRGRSAVRVEVASELIGFLETNEVDVVILNDTPPGLAARVVLDGTLLAAHDPEALHAFTRDVQLRRADLVSFLARADRLKREALAR